MLNVICVDQLDSDSSSSSRRVKEQGSRVELGKLGNWDLWEQAAWVSTYLTVWVDILFPAALLICLCLLRVLRYGVRRCVSVRGEVRTDGYAGLIFLLSFAEVDLIPVCSEADP